MNCLAGRHYPCWLLQTDLNPRQNSSRRTDTFIFHYRKLGDDFFKGKGRETLFRTIRPTGNSLPGYTPSYALNRVLDEVL